MSVARDGLARFLPALLGLTLLAAVVEAGAAQLFREPVFARASVSTVAFAMAVLIAGYQARAGRPVRARLLLAVSLTLFGAIGALLVPGSGQATALLPIVSFILVLPNTSRRWLISVAAITIGSCLAILVVDGVVAPSSTVADIRLTAFQDLILVGVVVLVLVGLADFAMEARDSLRDLRESTKRQLSVTTARLSLVAALRRVRRGQSAEATAGLIATALADLPMVDLAVVLEATDDDGLAVLAAVGSEVNDVRVSESMPAARAAYVLDRSGSGAWAERWADRPCPGLDDEELTRLGVQGQAFAPILAEDEIVGIVSISTTDRDEAEHLVADLPSVSEAAAVAGAILAPMLVTRRRTSIAKVHIAETIETSAFHIVFQPIVELQSGLIVGFEALTRFDSLDPPNQVFADAADAGLGPDLEAATLTVAVRDAARLPMQSWLALNVSPGFLSEPARLISILGRRTRAITLEVTEHEVIDDYGPILDAMRLLGPDIRLAVDDAGAGVANFGHLVELRPALVKIDAGLIRGVNADVSRQAAVVGFVHFAAVSGALVLAEGIETEPEQQMVQGLGVTLGQGYLLGRPAPIAAWAKPPSRLPDVLAPNVIPIRNSA